MDRVISRKGVEKSVAEDDGPLSLAIRDRGLLNPSIGFTLLR